MAEKKATSPKKKTTAKRETPAKKEAVKKEPSAIVKKTENVPATKEMVEKTMIQLKELTTLRREEMDRQERFMSQMKEAAQRQQKLYRTITGAAVAILLVGVIILGMLKGFAKDQDQLSTDMRAGLSTQSNLTEKVSGEIAETRKTFKDVATKQSGQIDGVLGELATTRAQQSGMTREIMINSEKYLASADRVLNEVSTAGKKQAEIAEALRAEIERTKLLAKADSAKRTAEMKSLRKEGNAQARELSAIKKELDLARKSQTAMIDNFSRQLAETHKRQREVAKEIEQSLVAIRSERDSIQKNVETVLKEESRKLSAREAKLSAELSALRNEKAQSSKKEKELETRRIIIEKAMRELQNIDSTPAPETKPKPNKRKRNKQN